jgi:hypothetical protein
MTDSEIEKDADECWALWRKSFVQSGLDPSKFSEMEIWHHAYRAGIELGIELGKDLESEDCAKVAERFAQTDVARIIRLRVTLRNAK